MAIEQSAEFHAKQDDSLPTETGTSTNPQPVANQPGTDPLPCDVAYSVTTNELLSFVRLDEIVPCDLNQDSIVDVLALNHRLSTGYGFVGIGNGLFAEGPYLDLPFRPAAAAAAGDPIDNAVLLVSSEGTIALFHPVLTQDPPTQVRSTEIHILRLGSGLYGGPLAVVGAQGMLGPAEVYEATATSLTLLGDYRPTVYETATEWYDAVHQWMSSHETVPLPPDGMSELVAIADLNCDNLPDLVSCTASGRVTAHLSDGVSRLAREETLIDDGRRFVDLCLVDMNANGLVDVLLLDSTGSITVLLAHNSSRD